MLHREYMYSTIYAVPHDERAAKAPKACGVVLILCVGVLHIWKLSNKPFIYINSYRLCASEFLACLLRDIYILLPVFAMYACVCVCV